MTACQNYEVNYKDRLQAINELDSLTRGKERRRIEIWKNLKKMKLPIFIFAHFPFRGENTTKNYKNFPHQITQNVAGKWKEKMAIRQLKQAFREEKIVNEKTKIWGFATHT